MNLKFVRIDIKFRYWIPIASVVLGGVVSAQIDGYTLLNRIDWTKIDFGKSDQKTDDDWVPWSSDADFPILLNSETEVRLKLLKKTDTEDRKDVELDVDYEDVFRDGIRTSNGDIQLEFLGLKEGPYTVVLLSADGKAKGSAPLGKFEILIDGKTVARASYEKRRRCWIRDFTANYFFQQRGFFNVDVEAIGWRDLVEWFDANRRSSNGTQVD